MIGPSRDGRAGQTGIKLGMTPSQAIDLGPSVIFASRMATNPIDLFVQPPCRGIPVGHSHYAAASRPGQAVVLAEAAAIPPKRPIRRFHCLESKPMLSPMRNRRFSPSAYGSLAPFAD